MKKIFFLTLITLSILNLAPASFAAGVARGPDDDDSSLYIRGLPQDNYCARFLAKYPDVKNFATSLSKEQTLQPSDIAEIKKHLSCYSGMRNYCDTIGSFDLDQQTLNLSIEHNQNAYTFKKDGEFLEIKDSVSDAKGNLISQSMTKLKYVNGNCFPWSRQDEKNGKANSELSLDNCPAQSDCAKNAYWKLYSSAVGSSAQHSSEPSGVLH